MMSHPETRQQERNILPGVDYVGPVGTLLRIFLVIVLMEMVVMLLLDQLLPQMNLLSKALLDAAFLTLFAAPLIYLYVVRPFILSRNEALAQYALMAYRDPLTGLANRRQLIESLDRALAAGVRHRLCGALIMIDLDGFKEINDKYGHRAGDILLIELAERLRKITRTEDIVCRYGGDEFVVLLTQYERDEIAARTKALEAARKIQQAITEPVNAAENQCALEVGASIGVTLVGNEEPDAASLIHKADVLMYQAKRAGGNRINACDAPVLLFDAHAGSRAISGG